MQISMSRYLFFFGGLLFVFFALSCSNESVSGADAGRSGQAAVPDGQKVYKQQCVTCHGIDGKLGLNGAKDLSQTVLPLEERILQISKGKNLMTPFEGILSPEEIRAVAEYTFTLQQK